jgi:hypothetical protein
MYVQIIVSPDRDNTLVSVADVTTGQHGQQKMNGFRLFLSFLEPVAEDEGMK